MALAVLSVAVLIWLVRGRREAVIVLLAIPATLALTLAVFNLYGYTLNRITLFALIFSIGSWSMTRSSWWRTSRGTSGCRRTRASGR